MVSQNLEEGVRALIQGQALGALQPNLVMMGWSSDAARSAAFVTHLNSVLLLGRSVVLVKDRDLPKEEGKKRIDIWWRGKKNGSLMVLLGHLLTLNWEWAGSEIRLIRLIRNEAGRQPATDDLNALVEAGRVRATVCVLASEAPFPDVLHLNSRDASLVMLGIQLPEASEALEFQAQTEQILAGLPTTLLICSSGEADLFQ